MGDLTKNFSRSEFACQCGCGTDDINLVLVVELQKLRDKLGKSIRVTSGIRCSAHNKKVGGVPNSRHVRAEAADIQVAGVEPSVVQDTLREMFPDKYGVGRYKTFTHFDVRERRADW